MRDLVGPPPRDEDVDIQEALHGKSESSSRTASVVSGGWPTGAAKIIAPVCGHVTSVRLSGLEQKEDLNTANVRVVQ